MNPTIQTASGREFHLVTPSPDSIVIEDIAHALSHLCRYTGHCQTFYSVAQHSYLVSRIVEETEPEHALRALLHDASEAYLGDVSSPLKQLLQDYRLLEANVMDAINFKFGITGPEPRCIKTADIIALKTEKRDLMPNGWEWEYYAAYAPRARPITALPPPLARNLFLNRYHELAKVVA